MSRISTPWRRDVCHTWTLVLVDESDNEVRREEFAEPKDLFRRQSAFQEAAHGGETLDHSGNRWMPPTLGLWRSTRRRLPILGETAVDAAMREIADDWSFGPWLWSNSRYPHFSVKDGHSRYHGETGRLFWTIDQECDPSLITIQELRELQAHPHVYAGGHLEDCDDADCIGCDGRDRDDDEEEECDSDECLACDLADQSEFIERKVAAFIAACLRARGLGTKSAKHACSSSLVPLTPPETSGVYFVAADDRVKIGKAKNIRKRISELQTAAPHKLVLCNWIDSPDPGAEESRQHQTFKPLRVVGEWFLAKGALRRFILAENARLAPQHGSAP